jgi:hypothetical protein
MAINLDKIRADLNHRDPQIQTFALMSITRLSPELVNSAIEVQSIHDKLSELVKSPNSDVVFLARKAVNHIDAVFKPFLKEAHSIRKPELSDPRSMTREDLLNVVDPSLDATYLASLMVRFIAVGEVDDLSTLRDYLYHENPRVRSNVVEVFEALGNGSHVDLIKPLTQDKNNRVRGNAILALVALGYNDVGRELDQMLCMGMISMRETAVFVLSKLSLPFVEKLLVKATADPYEGVKLRATKALSAFVSPVAITRLRELMNDIDINICEAAIESLQIIKRTHQANKSRKAAQQKAVPQEVVPQKAVPQEAAPKVVPVPEPVVVPKKPVPQVVSAPQPPVLQSMVLPDEDDEYDDLTDAAIDESMERKIVVARTIAEEAEAASSDKRLLYRELGTSIYQLCRTNSLSHEIIDAVFYDILRYQDFLRAYLSRKHGTDDSDMESRSAIEQLQLKIEESFVSLGKSALPLINDSSLDLTMSHEMTSIVTELNS